MLVTLNVLRGQIQLEPDVVPTVVAWREFLTVYACGLMLLGMNGVVDYVVDSRSRDSVTRFEDVAFLRFCH